MLLDTHTALWLRAGDARLGHVARAEIQRAWESDAVALSAISYWKIAMLRDKDRIRYPVDVELWRREFLPQGMVEIPIDGEIAARAGFLESTHADPADRIIVATALQGHTLVTADQAILEWRGNLARLDARGVAGVGSLKQHSPQVPDGWQLVRLGDYWSLTTACLCRNATAGLARSNCWAVKVLRSNSSLLPQTTDGRQKS